MNKIKLLVFVLILLFSCKDDVDIHNIEVEKYIELLKAGEYEFLVSI